MSTWAKIETIDIGMGCPQQRRQGAVFLIPMTFQDKHNEPGGSLYGILVEICL